MEKLKFALFSIVTLSLLGLLGYWSVVTLQSGSESKASQKVETLQKENAELVKKVAEYKSEIGFLQQEIEKQKGLQAQATTTVNVPAAATVTATYKYQDLINALQKMVSSKVTLKLKSRGTQVGTVQKFLNIYNNTSNKVDNDYGEGTKAAVIAFQKAVGLSADGEAGPGTFNKMIDWLKKQN